MNIVVDTSVIIAVVTNEQHKAQLVGVSKGADLIAPSSLHWEIGNAFSAMIKRKRIDLRQARQALRAYGRIPIQFSDIDLERSLELAANLNLYAYDAYIIQCALNHRSPVLTLDRRLVRSAKRAGAAAIEVTS